MVGVAVLRPHVIRLLFDDGLVRDVQNLPGEANGPLLDPLAEADYFAQVRRSPLAPRRPRPNLMTGGKCSSIPPGTHFASPQSSPQQKQPGGQSDYKALKALLDRHQTSGVGPTLTR